MALAITLAPDLMLSGQSGAPLVPAAPAEVPTATLVRATTLRLSGRVDSNSPAIWELVDGRTLFHVVTSFGGAPNLAVGSDLARIGAPEPIVIDPHPGEGVWIEGIIRDVDGTWYGYYHHELTAGVCQGVNKALPRIGAIRSRDYGRTWENLGTILQAPDGSHDCETTNRYFVGGVGDFSVMLDDKSQDLYFFYSQYLRRRSFQGIVAARLAWADRDEPVGRISVWRDGIWAPSQSEVSEPSGQDGMSALRWIYRAGKPFFRAIESWHDDDTEVDAFWGPSVHWNSYLEQYVMLLNHAKDSDWSQEGIYVSFNSRLDDPSGWSPPARIVTGGSWYPQVMGTERAVGTDKVAGQVARLFMSGRSDHLVRFSK